MLPIIHVHGTLDTTYQITETDLYEEDHKLVQSMLLSAIIGARAFVFVGYGMADPDFLRLYHTHRKYIKNDRKKEGKMTYAVTPLDCPHEYQLADAVMEQRETVLIPLSASDFFAELRERLDNTIEREKLQVIARKFDLNPDDSEQIWEKVDGFTNVMSREEAVEFLVHIAPPYENTQKHG